MKKSIIKTLIVISLTLLILGLSTTPSLGTIVNLKSESNIYTTNYGELVVYFIDVGQGDAILIQTPENNFVLIDTGSKKYDDTLVDFIRNLGVTTLQAFVATHPHEDHIGGCVKLFEQFEILNVYHPGYEMSSQIYQDFIEAAENEFCQIYTDDYLDPGDYIEISNNYDVECQILSINKEADNANDASIVLKLEFNDISFLFTGDIETEVEEYLVDYWDVDIDILKVAHHGSSSSSSDLFLYEATPETAIICVGEDNRYGHPHQEALDRLEYHCQNIYRTDINGDITVTVDREGKDYSVSCEKSVDSPYTPQINGPTYGEEDVEYDYSAYSIDPEGDYIYYYWDWGDGTQEISDPCFSGETCYAYHEWDEGTYIIKVQAIDDWGHASPWAKLSVQMPRTKSKTNILLQNILENLQQHFPLLHYLINS
jgi:competence protein ComEC